MIKVLAGIAVAAMMLAASAVHAQTPPQQQLAPTARINLTLEQRHVIRELIKELKVEPAKTPLQPAVGDALPQEVTLRPMPNEIGRKVPQIKTHRFLVTDDQIVIVDPKDNKVAELIELKAD